MTASVKKVVAVISDARTYLKDRGTRKKNTDAGEMLLPTSVMSKVMVTMEYAQGFSSSEYLVGCLAHHPAKGFSTHQQAFQ